MRTKMKVLRVMNHLSQKDAADKLECGRSTYSAIESGQRNGTQAFWTKFQETFNVPDSDMWELMRDDEEPETNHCDCSQA